jgi:hypothetical protein
MTELTFSAFENAKHFANCAGCKEKESKEKPVLSHALDSCDWSDGACNEELA